MALTSTISNTIKDPNGNVVAGALVTITLMPTAGFRVDDSTEVARVISTTTNASGFWSLALERNSNITPSASWYQVDEYVPQSAGGTRTWQIAVGATNQTVLASLVTPADTQPTVVPSGTVYITQAAGDARYQALSALGSSTPAAETAGAAGTAGVSTSASRADHIHPAATGTPVAVGTANAAGVAATFAASDHVHTGAALGTMGSAVVTANQGTFTAETDLTGLTVTFTAVAGRRYRVTASGGAFGTTVASDEIGFFIKEGATYLAKATATAPVANRNLPFHLEAEVTGASAGSHTYKLSAARTAGTGAITFVAAAANNAGPAFILVEDIGV